MNINDDDYPIDLRDIGEEDLNLDIDKKQLGIRYYEYGMQLLRKYKYEWANAYLRVAYDLLQEHKSLDCYPELCYRIECGLPLRASTDTRIQFLEEALDGFNRLASMGKPVSAKKIKSIKDSLKLLHYLDSEHRCEDVVSPDATSKVKRLELINDFLGYDYTNRCQFHDATIHDITWRPNEVVLRININDECIATFRFIDAVNMDGEFEWPYLNEMKFHMYNSFVECDLCGVGATITSKEVVCEKVEKYEEGKTNL